LQTVDVADTPIKIDLALFDLVKDFVLAYQRSASCPSFCSSFRVGRGDDADPYISLDRVRES
jgi:hypothetical protein